MQALALGAAAAAAAVQVLLQEKCNDLIAHFSDNYQTPKVMKKQLIGPSLFLEWKWYSWAKTKPTIFSFFKPNSWLEIFKTKLKDTKADKYKINMFKFEFFNGIANMIRGRRLAHL